MRKVFTFLVIFLFSFLSLGYGANEILGYNPTISSAFCDCAPSIKIRGYEYCRSCEDFQ